MLFRVSEPTLVGRRSFLILAHYDSQIMHPKCFREVFNQSLGAFGSLVSFLLARKSSPCLY